MYIVFDLDGTLANLDHRLHYIKGPGPKDWPAFYRECVNDSVIEPIAAVYRSLRAQQNFIEIWSGRSDIVRDVTRDWLYDNGLGGFVHLKMRRNGDYRPDEVIKREWLHAIDPHLRPLLAFDDRQRIVDMWRSEGIQCCQVAVWEEINHGH